MIGFSPVDGFVEISENLAEMIKYLANEPSVGLFYIQQHTHKAVPNLISLGDNVAAKSNETAFHTEDLEDSITMVKSMKENGFPIVDEMIKDIKKSLVIMSTKQSEGSSRSGLTSSWGRGAVDNQQDGQGTSYLSSVFKSAKQKASNIKWPQLDIGDSIQEKGLSSASNETVAVQSASRTSATPDIEGDKLKLSSPFAEERQEKSQSNVHLSNENLLATSENYDEFKADKEARLEKWLEGTDN